MTGRSMSALPAQEVKAELDSFVVTIELTLISIIQGVALAVLAASSWSLSSGSSCSSGPTWPRDC